MAVSFFTCSSFIVIQTRFFILPFGLYSDAALFLLLFGIPSALLSTSSQPTIDKSLGGVEKVPVFKLPTRYPSQNEGQKGGRLKRSIWRAAPSASAE